MSGYFRSGDKINLDQTEVEISAENGLSFKENNVIGIYVPPSVRFFSGKQSRLSFDVELSPDTANDAAGNPYGATAMMLDGTIGGSSLFSKCRVYAGNRAQLIEELDDYDTFVSVKYSYESNDSVRNKRALTEGASVWTPECRSTTGQRKSNQADVMTNPYFEQRFHGEARIGGTDTTAIADKMQKAHIEIPLHMGCLANNSKAFPNVLTDGLYIELTCNPARKVMRTLDTTNLYRSKYNLPVFSGANAADTDWANGTKRTTLFINPDHNMQIDAQHVPFVVGEIVGLWNATDDKEVETDIPLVIQNIKQTGANPVLTIPSAEPKAASDNTDVGNKEYYLYSKSLHEAGSYNPQYTISDVKFIVHRVDVGAQYEQGMMAKMKSGGVISFDIPSVQCHKNSVVKADRQATLNINIDHAKARSIISVPTDASVYTANNSINSVGTYKWFQDSAATWYSDSTGLTGCGDNLTSYNYQLNGMLVPSRAVSTEFSANDGVIGGINGEHILELEKALLGGGIVPLSFKDYRKNFCIGRVLAMDPNTVYDGRGVDTRLLLSYTGDAKTIQTLWKNYVFHIKTLNIQGDGIQIEN
jgi:hypothetical protein